MQQSSQLIDDVRHRRRGSSEALVRQYGQEVFALVVKMLPSVEDAEEVAQNAFLKALQSIERFDAERASLSTWLCRIAYQQAIDWLRRRKMPMLSLDAYEAAGGAGADADVAVAPSDRIAADEPIWLDADEEREERIARLMAALQQLDAAERSLVTMRYFDGRSLADIAYITQLREGNVASCIAYERNFLI